MVVKDGYRVFFCNTRTGKISGGDVPAADMSWEIGLNGPGKVTAKFRPRADELKKFDIRGLTATRSQSIGVAYGDQILECGPIWFRDYENGILTVDAAGLWSVFDRRKVIPGEYLAWTPQLTTKAKKTISGKSLGSIARELVRMSIQDNPFNPAYGALNVLLPADVAGAHTRTYYGYDLGWIGDRLRELSKVEGGPDIRFRPRFKPSDPTFVEWVLETGTDAKPLLTQNGQDWVWDGTAPNSGTVDFGHHQDGSETAAMSWAPGSGQEASMKLAAARNLAAVKAGAPWTEADQASKQTENMTVLQSSANRLQADRTYPWDSFTVSVRADQDPRLGDYQPGDWASIIVPEDHPTLDPGKQRVRIMAISGGLGSSVKLTVAPTQDTSASTYGKRNHVSGPGDETLIPWDSLPAGLTWDELDPGIPWDSYEGNN